MGNGPRQQAAGRDKAKSIRSFKGIGRQIEARRQETERKQEESEWLRNVERMREDTRRRAVQWLEDMEKQVVKGQGESEKRREIEAEKRRETEMREQLREAQRRRDAKLEAQRLVTIRSAAEIIKQQKFTAW
ncbi:hypothetical protein BC629DRAFT_1048285 [Irpex lacteus]|nr:hypothetical protein BC629DRAFT_1048285 [Irpex lacteus]